MSTHSSILAWEISGRGAWRATVRGIPRVGCNLVTKPSTIYGKESACQQETQETQVQSLGWDWRKKWQPTYSCLRNLTDRGPWQATVHGVVKKSDTLVGWTRSMSYKTVLGQLLVFLQIMSHYCNQSWLKGVSNTIHTRYMLNGLHGRNSGNI